jgi:hypothetical protein
MRRRAARNPDLHGNVPEDSRVAPALAHMGQVPGVATTPAAFVGLPHLARGASA